MMVSVLPPQSVGSARNHSPTPTAGKNAKRLRRQSNMHKIQTESSGSARIMREPNERSAPGMPKKTMKLIQVDSQLVLLAVPPEPRRKR